MIGTSVGTLTGRCGSSKSEPAVARISRAHTNRAHEFRSGHVSSQRRVLIGAGKSTSASSRCRLRLALSVWLVAGRPAYGMRACVCVHCVGGGAPWSDGNRGERVTERARHRRGQKKGEEHGERDRERERNTEKGAGTCTRTRSGERERAREHGESARQNGDRERQGGKIRKRVYGSARSAMTSAASCRFGETWTTHRWLRA